MTPVRIQRQRTKGWRMPEGAIYVGRPSPWGNRYRTGASYFDGPAIDSSEAVEMYRAEVAAWLEHEPEWIAPLRGHDLACWCPLDQPCHADVLLELANR